MLKLRNPEITGREIATGKYINFPILQTISDFFGAPRRLTQLRPTALFCKSAVRLSAVRGTLMRSVARASVILRTGRNVGARFLVFFMSDPGRFLSHIRVLHKKILLANYFLRKMLCCIMVTFPFSF